MNVLHVTSTLDPTVGGPVAALRGLVVAQRKAGISAGILATFREGEDQSVADDLRAKGVPVTSVGPCTGPLRRHPSLAGALASHVQNVDVVHIHAVWEEVQHLAASTAAKLEKPFIMTPHGMLTDWAMARKRLKKLPYYFLRVRTHLKRAAAVQFTTDWERDASLAHIAGANHFIEMIGIDWDEFETLPPRGSFRSAHDIGERPLIAYMGRVYPGKGLEYLVPAMAHVRQQDALLVIIGPDTDGWQPEVERMIRERRLTDRVIFTGMLRGPARVPPLVDADIFCQPSDHENFGLAIVEALAAETPVIISRDVAIHQRIVDAGVGVTVDRNEHAVAAMISKWLADAEGQAEAAAKARAFARDHFAWPAIAARWQDHYTRLM